MEAAVVILNWNGHNLLEKFLPDVVAHSAGKATVYVVDNASTDASVAYIREAFPQVKIIQNPENYGFAKGYNQALKQVSEPIYVLLNSDVEVSLNWLDAGLAVFSESELVAAVQPKIKNYQNRGYFEYAGAAGGFIDRLGYPYCRGRIFNSLEKDFGQYNDKMEIFWATGACMFVRKDLFWEVGGFDEDYFAHQEEIDLCWRFYNRGYQIVYTAASTVYHLGGGTLSTSSPRKTFLNFRNSLFNLLKNAPNSSYRLLIIFRLVLDGLAGIRFALQLKFRHLLAIVSAHFSFYKQFRKIHRKRYPIQNKTPYYRINSIVYQYFILNKKKFNP